jgi:3-hydroxyacyl-[acyl-carrier-protein] dehydratase
MKTNPKFLNDLYTVKGFQESGDGNKVVFFIELKPDHPIFEGHFPGNPVLPGVCTVEIIKELAGYHLDKSLMLKKAGTIKYLSFINPLINKAINVEIQCKEDMKGHWTCNAVVYYENTTFCSCKGELVEFE